MEEQNPEKITSETRYWYDKAITLVKRHNLLNRLGIVDDDDIYLFAKNLAIRLIRGKIYENSLTLSDPLAPTVVKIPVIGWSAKILDNQTRKLKELLQAQETSADKFVRELPTEEQRRKARIIELAVNDLVVKGTTSNTKTPHSEPKLTPELLNAWEQNWRNKIK